MFSGGRKFGRCHATSPPRRASLQPAPYSPSRQTRAKSNGDIGGRNFSEFSKILELDSGRPSLALFNAIHDHREQTQQAIDVKEAAKTQQSPLRRSRSEYAARSSNRAAFASSATATLELQHLPEQDCDEERKPLLTRSYTDAAGAFPKCCGGGGGGPPSSVCQPSQQKLPIILVGRANTLPAKSRNVLIEEEDDEYDEEITEADDDHCEPLTRTKKRTRIWARLSRKRQCESAESAAIDHVPATHHAPDRSGRRQPKSSVVSSYSSTLTTQSSSHFMRSPETGRSVTRGAATTDFDTTDASAGQQRVHANRCELYTNRAILLCILSGFVLFFVGSVSFVAYVLAEKSYGDELKSSQMQ